MNPNVTQENTTLNSCQYTPVYLIQNNSITQARSYVLAPTVQEEQRPVSNNLKLFYENSGNIENSVLLNNVQYVPSPPPQKQVQEPAGNNLKLASFLVPKKDATKQQYIATISNKILKPTVSCSNTNVLPNVNIVSSKPNGVRNKPNPPRTLLKPRILPKIKPKEQSPEPSQNPSVQLLKLGALPMGLNHLNEQQRKLVNQALENLQNKETDKPKTQLKTSFDSISNTRIVYKVVSPSDLKIVGKNKIVIKTAPKREPSPKEDIPEPIDVEEQEPPPVPEVKVTRRGRTVKLPKHIQQTQEEPPPKTKKKSNTVISCFQCSGEFTNIYRLQRHYEKFPTHIPTNIHTSLFHCLLAMVQDGNEDKTGLFIGQLEKLVDKLKSILPCLLKKIDGREGTMCNINEDLGRLFGMNPGKYNINIDALNCVKDSEGYCRHNPAPKPQFTTEIIQTKSKQIWLPIPNPNLDDTHEIEIEDCARINSVEKWPVKRIWNHNKQNVMQNKKLKLNCEIEPLIELGIENFDFSNKTNVNNEHLQAKDDTDLTKIIEKKNKGSHKQFYSTHFDIRSSPIKPTSTVFNKFQILPEKLPLKFDTQILRPLTFDEQDTSIHNGSDNSLDLNGIFKELKPSDNHDSLDVPHLGTNDACKEIDVINTLEFTTPKNWTLSDTVEQNHDNCLKSNSILPSMIHVQDNAVDANAFDDPNYNNDGCTNFSSQVVSNGSVVENDSIMSDNREQSVLNFLDALGNDLSCPETELRNNSIDFSLDLFSFNNT